MVVIEGSVVNASIININIAHVIVGRVSSLALQSLCSQVDQDKLWREIWEGVGLLDFLYHGTSIEIRNKLVEELDELVYS